MRRRHPHTPLLLVLAALALLLAPAARAQSVHHVAVQWRVALVDPPSAAWKPREYGGVVLSPAGTYLYAVAATGLRALDVRNGDVLWDLPTSERVASRPAVAGGAVYVATHAGAVYALDGKTGRKLWPEPARLQAPVLAPLAVDDRHVYVVADPGMIAAFERGTGRAAWRHTADVTRDFLVEGQGGALPHAGSVYVGKPDGKLASLSARDGGVTWEIDLSRPGRNPYADVDTTPVLVRRAGGDWLLAASHNGGLHAVAASDGGSVWHYDAVGLGQPVVHRGVVYTVAAGGLLHLVDLGTGQRRLVRKLDAPAAGRLTVTDDGFVLVPGESGLDVLSAWTGRAIVRAATETGFAAAPLAWGSTLFAVSNGGVLYALALR